MELRGEITGELERSKSSPTNVTQVDKVLVMPMGPPPSQLPPPTSEEPDV